MAGPSNENKLKAFMNARLKAVLENENRETNIKVMEVMIEELEKLTSRTTEFVNNMKLTLAVRESVLKNTQSIPVDIAVRMLKNLPEFPEVPRPRPKVLDQSLIAHLVYNGYVRPNLEEITDENFIDLVKIQEMFDCTDSADEGEKESSIPDSPESPENQREQDPNFTHHPSQESDELGSPYVEIMRLEDEDD